MKKWRVGEGIVVMHERKRIREKRGDSNKGEM